MRARIWILPILLSPSLAACGGSESGGGGGIASTPPPVPAVTATAASPVASGLRSPLQTITGRTPLPQTVATTAGTYETIAYVTRHNYDANGAETGRTAQFTNPAPLRLTVDPAGPAFTVAWAQDGTTAERKYIGRNGPALYNGGDDFFADFGNRVTAYYYQSDGTAGPVRTVDVTRLAAYGPAEPAGAEFSGALKTSANTDETSSFSAVTGLSYVSYGSWTRTDFFSDATTRRPTGSLDVQFIYGQRTAPSDLPASGTAMYRDTTGVLQLAADFAARTIGANLDYPEKFVEGCNCGDGTGGWDGNTVIAGIKASGSAPIAADVAFSIPLTGFARTPVDADRANDAVAPVTGTFAGAFFGPQAIQVGGLAEILGENGKPLSDSAQTWAGVPFLLTRP